VRGLAGLRLRPGRAAHPAPRCARRAGSAGKRPRRRGVAGALTAAIAALPYPSDAPRDDEALARILDAALGDLALWIAASDDPPATRVRAGRAIDRLLAGLDLVPRPLAGAPDAA
jgi:hypothetical protein